MSLGQYDEVSLKEAREAVAEAKKILGTGKRPDHRQRNEAG
jgi:hypothetical protein